MDHRISKDMISNGMTPSGQKSQQDLSRSQYGSAATPASLAEAYRKIHEMDERSPEANDAKQEAAKLAAQKPRDAAKPNQKPNRPGGGLRTPVTAGGGVPSQSGQVDRYRQMARERARKNSMGMESADLFDIVKGHPIDEQIPGFTPSAFKDMKQYPAVYKGEKGMLSGDEGATGRSFRKDPEDYDRAVKQIELNKKSKPTSARGAGRATFNQNNSVDLFDIVKGYLMSEGLSEEDALKKMLEMTEEEKAEIVEGAPYVITNADMKGNTKAYQNFKAGMKNKLTGKPLYVAAPHLKGV